MVAKLSTRKTKSYSVLSPLDAIIVAGHPLVPSHQEIINIIIRRFKPKDVLIKRDPEGCKDEKERLETYTLGDAIEAYGISKNIINRFYKRIKNDIEWLRGIKPECKYEDLTPEFFDELASKDNFWKDLEYLLPRMTYPYKVVIPNSLEELLNDPFWMIHPYVILILRNVIREELNSVLTPEDKDKKIEKLHITLDLYLKDVFNYFIRRIDGGAKANFIMYVLSAIRETGANMECYDASKYIIRMASREKGVGRYTIKREEIMGKNIANLTKKAKEKPVIVITDLFHVRENSKMLETLEKEGIKYWVTSLPVYPGAYSEKDQERFENYIRYYL